MSQTNEDLPVEYWVKEASEGRNIAECWQAINKAHKEEIRKIVESVPDFIQALDDGYAELDDCLEDWKQEQLNKLI